MVKYDIYGDGKIVELSEDEFYKFLVKFANICFSLAKSYIGDHSSGLADFANERYKSTLGRIQKQYEIGVQGVSDEELKQNLFGLVNLLYRLSQIDDQVIAAYREAILKERLSKNPDKNLDKLVYKYLYRKHLPPPVIVKQIAEDTKIFIPELEDLHKKVVSRIYIKI
jgi:hypothetical protein